MVTDTDAHIRTVAVLLPHSEIHRCHGVPELLQPGVERGGDVQMVRALSAPMPRGRHPPAGEWRGGVMRPVREVRCPDLACFQQEPFSAAAQEQATVELTGVFPP
ncbi:hypothetical protein GCM10023223_40800 [Stackebrandtia albiflava]